MSARKSRADLFRPITVQSAETIHILSPESFRIRKNGIEFSSSTEVGLWTEMTVEVQLPDGKSFTCSGVVVACSGNRHAGYNLSLAFTSLTEQAQQRLNDFSSIAAISQRI